MFRSMRRNKQALSKEECFSLLKNEKRAVLAVNGDDGYPYAIFVNYIFDEKENAIYLHGAKEGHKIDSLKKCDKVCFSIHNDGEKIDGDWAYTVKSVVIFGRASLISDINVTTSKVRDLALKYYPNKEDVEKEIEGSIKYVQLIKIEIENITGKVIKEK